MEESGWVTADDQDEKQSICTRAHKKYCPISTKLCRYQGLLLAQDPAFERGALPLRRRLSDVLKLMHDAEVKKTQGDFIFR